MNPKIFIGPMSKNTVDSVIEFCNNTGNIIGLIPSRRQIEYNGGYVNNWTTKEFSDYVKNKTDKIIIQRDHSGPSQGQYNDDGYESLKHDCMFFDLIHIDPWKKYQDYEDGLKATSDMINFCYNLNPLIEYEIGTEESIRRFESNELDKLVNDLKIILNPEIFKKIKILVIQSGTSLKGNNQTGNYDKNRLIEMVDVAKKHKLISKEHNGDYITTVTIKEKFDLGLDCINIAPEFGLLETEVFLDEIVKSWSFSLMDVFFNICYKSKKWEKWVNSDFNPLEKRFETIKISGHYIFSDKDFIEKIKSNFNGIDNIIKLKIKNKLNELH